MESRLHFMVVTHWRAAEMMRDQIGYHILLGKRYVRWSQEWLGTKACGALLTQRPIPDTMIDGEALARQILQTMLESKQLSTVQKAKLGLQRITVRTLTPPR